MSQNPRTNAESIEVTEGRVMSILEKTMGMTIGMSEDDSLYTIDFLSQKLAKTSKIQEDLSDYMLELTKIAIEVKRMASGLKAKSVLREKELKASDDYRNESRESKAFWLANQLQPVRDECESWVGLNEMVSEVRSAVSERLGTVKRLDSDLRLHAKIYESKKDLGTNPQTPRSPGTQSDLDIN